MDLNVFSVDALTRAWETVLANDAEDGVMSAGVTRFEEEAEARIAELAVELADGGYVPRDVTEVRMEQGAKERVLHIPAVRDRVVERAVLAYLTPIVDPLLGPGAYAYRPGLGVDDAVQALAALRGEGLGWVVRTDVKNCFPSLPVALIRRRLTALIDDVAVLRVCNLLLDRVGNGPRGRRAFPGLPQGSALSPILANLVLMDVDAKLMEEGFPMVRYADDMAIAAADPDEAQEALRLVSQAVGELGMELGTDKTRIMSFEEGFAFLGEDFGPRYPPELTDSRAPEPDRKVLYVGRQGSRVQVHAGRIEVEKDEKELLSVPTTHVERIVLFGSVGLTAGARTWALANDIDVILASWRGNYLGALVSDNWPARSSRLTAQLDIEGTDAATLIARVIVEAKIGHQIVVLQRFGRRSHREEVRDAVTQMRQYRLMLPDATTQSELMGLEGAAAKAYWPCYGSMFPDELQFVERSRQPPMDLANSALGFLYTVLQGECVTALHAVGLDPGIGILHSASDRAPSLAFDLMEEFRPLIVDRVVLQAARRGSLGTEHARTANDKPGVLLTAAGRTSVLTAYETMMLTRASGALPGFAGTWRRHLYRQAQRLMAAVVDPASEWRGMSWR